MRSDVSKSALSNRPISKRQFVQTPRRGAYQRRPRCYLPEADKMEWQPLDLIALIRLKWLIDHHPLRLGLTRLAGLLALLAGDKMTLDLDNLSNVDDTTGCTDVAKLARAVPLLSSLILRHQALNEGQRWGVLYSKLMLNDFCVICFLVFVYLLVFFSF